MRTAARTVALILTTCTAAWAQPVTHPEMGLVRHEISGPPAVPRGSSVQYRLLSIGASGSIVTAPKSWRIEPPELAEPGESHIIFSEGAGDAEAVITAVYEEQGQERETSLSVRIIDTERGPGFALWFDGERARAVVPRTPRLETAEMTLEMWARIEGPQLEHARLARKIAPAGKHGYALSVSQGNTPRVEFRQFNPLASDPADLARYAGRWHHYAIVYDRSSARLLIDGQVVDGRPHTLGPMRHAPPVDLIIGSGVEPRRETFRGTIDEVRIWARPLSADEINARMFKPLKGDEPGLRAWYRCDDPLSQKLLDSSTNAIHGYLGESLMPDLSDPAVVISDRPRTIEEFLLQRSGEE